MSVVPGLGGVFGGVVDQGFGDPIDIMPLITGWTDSGGWGGQTIRVVVPVASLTDPGVPYSQIRILLQSPAVGFTTTSVYFGHQASSGDAADAASLTQVFFDGGNADVTLGGSTTKWSDPFAFVWNETDNLIFSAYITTGGQCYKAVTGAATFSKAGDHAATADIASPTTVASNQLRTIAQIHAVE